jgi:regulator of ribosome biosynthesis
MEVDQQPQPYTFDLGNMLCEDTNPMPSLRDAETKEALLAARAQSCAQALIHQLLKTCPITRSEDDGNLQITLPSPATPLPREKSVPKEKEKSKWEKFAAKKGIKAKKRDGKLEYDNEKGAWAPKYGYKGKKSNGGIADDWLVEVEKDGGDAGGEKKEKRARDKGDTARRNERIQKGFQQRKGRDV